MPAARKYLIADNDPDAEPLIIETLEPCGTVHFARTPNEAAKAAGQRWLGALVSLSLPRTTTQSVVRLLMQRHTTDCLVLLLQPADPAAQRSHESDWSNLTLPGALPILQKPLIQADLTTFAIRTVAAAWAHERRLTELVVHFSRKHGLIPREAEIVAATMAGVSRAELAASLRVSENTLKGPIRVLLAKCGVPSIDRLVSEILRSAVD
jgi:DNA-binding CsgD family transcriptional regulator